MITLLLRWFIALGIIVALCAAGIWFANNPGIVQLEWMGYLIEAPLWVAVSVVSLSILVTVLTIGLCLKMFYNISLFGTRRKLKRQHKGMQSVTRTLAAIATRDYDAARSHIQSSQHLLGDDLPINQLLHAHIASKTDQKGELMHTLHAMKSHGDTRLLACSSLSLIAKREDDLETALDYARQAYDIRPDMLDTMLRYFGLLIKTNRFDDARHLVVKARTIRTLAKPAYKHYLALVYQAEYAQSDEHDNALKNQLPEKVFKLDPSLPLAHEHISQLFEQDKKRAALKALYAAWSAAPHAKLTSLLLAHDAQAQPDKIMARVKKLVDLHPDHAESHLAMARASIKLKQWDIARNHLKVALSIAPQMRVFRLLATLEERGFDDSSAAAAWLKRMQTAIPDPAWHCQSCGHRHESWQSHCVMCDAFDSYLWEAKDYIPADHIAQSGDVLSIETHAL